MYIFVFFVVISYLLYDIWFCAFQRDRVNYGDRDPSVDRPDPDHDKAYLRGERENRKRTERDNRRDRDRDEKDLDHDNMQRLLHKRKIRKVGENHIGEETEKFGTHSISSSYDDKSVLKSMHLSRHCKFIFLMFFWGCGWVCVMNSLPLW